MHGSHCFIFHLFLLILYSFLSVVHLSAVCLITGSPAGLSRVNGDGPNSAKMVKFNHLPKSQL